MFFLSRLHLVIIILLQLSSSYAAGPSRATYNNNFPLLPANYQAKKKATTVILYMAADNDLRAFVYRNLEEIKYLLRTTSAAENLNIFIHLDIHNPGQKKMTLHLVSYKKELHIAWQGEMDSGREETLVYAYEQAMRYSPGEKIILGLWNHGTGDLNPAIGKVFNPSNLYEFDPVEQKIILNRSIGFFDYIENFCPTADRGICFDDSTHNYLTNQNVGNALATICTTMREGKKIDLIFCDACLMAGIGFIREIAPWANYLIASEEVVLASGFRYDQVLNFFNQNNPDMESFIKHTTKVFEMTYQKITPDYTLTGINLQNLDQLYQSLNDISKILVEALKNQKNKSVKDFIRLSSWRTYCTSFDEPTYKDLKHLLLNFLKNLHLIQLNDAELEKNVKSNLSDQINQALLYISECVISHCAGRNLSQSGGISIYVPESRIHSSFQHTTFAKTTSWLKMITHYLIS